MYIKNLDRLYFEILILELCISKALIDGDFLSYKILAFKYAQLASKCANATFEWRY